MPYTKTDWTDETPDSTPIKYKLTDDTEGVIAESAKIEIVTGITTGTPLNAANLNKIEEGIETAQEGVDEINEEHFGAEAVRTGTNQSIPHNVETALIWDGETYDDNNFWDIGNPTRLTIPETGRYLVGVTARLVNDVGSLYVKLNGSITVHPSFQRNAVFMNLFTAGDYIEVTALQTTGSPVSISGGANFPRKFWIQRVK